MLVQLILHTYRTKSLLNDGGVCVDLVNLKCLYTHYVRIINQCTVFLLHARLFMVKSKLTYH